VCAWEEEVVVCLGELCRVGWEGEDGCARVKERELYYVA